MKKTSRKIADNVMFRQVSLSGTGIDQFEDIMLQRMSQVQDQAHRVTFHGERKKDITVEILQRLYKDTEMER
jgi:hypothetical protein